jgi:hypothetical protein
MPTRANFRLAIQVLTDKRNVYRGIALNGRYRYNDPEDEIRTWEAMAESLSTVIAHLTLEQEKCGKPA